MTSEGLKNYQDINIKNGSSLTDEISFKEILLNITYWFKYILSYWVIILVVMLIGGVIGFIRANKQKIRYIASSTFVLQEAGGDNENASNTFTSIIGFGPPAVGGMFQGDNLLELYRSRLMIKKTLLSKTDSSDYLIDRYIKISGLKQAWRNNPRLKNINFFIKADKKYARIQDSLISLFVNDINNNYLSVNRVGRLSIFRVQVVSENEEFSKLFNYQIVKTVNQFYIQSKIKKSTENLKLLQYQVDSIGSALNGAMYKVASSTDVNINSNLARQVLRIPSQRSQIEVENNRTMLNELVRNLEVSKMSLRKETPLIQIIDEPEYPLDKIQVSKTKAIMEGAFITGVIAIAYYSLVLLYKKILQ
ncbi:MAG: lipopolysaccharide biosynthesis protein [Mucilaginibacter sp.]|nr:lipopolysaccharide biosynthesis protein [Mucilaginibacter sp.]